MDGGAWWAAVHGVARSRTLLNDFTFTFHFHALEKEMATHPRDRGAWWAAVSGVTELDTTEVTSSSSSHKEPSLVSTCFERHLYMNPSVAKRKGQGKISCMISPGCLRTDF